VGDENPDGTLIFQRTFLSGPISVGGFSFSATPDPPGPRNCGHAESAAEAKVAEKAQSDAQRKSRRIIHSLKCSLRGAHRAEADGRTEAEKCRSDETNGTIGSLGRAASESVTHSSRIGRS